MDTRRYLEMGKRWLWLIALTTILAGGAAFAYARITQPVYKASTTLLVNMASSAGTMGYTELMASQNIAQTYSQLVKSRPVLNEVIKDLGLSVSSTELAGSVSVQTVRNTQLIQLSVEYPNAEIARDIANKTADVFITQNTALQRGQFQTSLDKLLAQMTTAETKAKQASDAIAALRSPGNTTPTAEKDAQIAKLQAELTRYQNEYATLMKSYDDMRLAEVTSINSVAVADPAIAPDGPIKPRPLTDTMLGLIVGLLLGVGVSFLLERLDSAVKDSADVNRVTGLATLAEIQRFPRAKTSADATDGLVTKHKPKSVFADSYRKLRTSIQFSTVDSPPRTIMITSVLPSEGKTTTVGNLAAIMAQGGKRVIVVDADLRKPTLHRLLGLKNAAGLTSALVSANGDMMKAMQPTGIEGVRALTSGPLPPYPAELLGSARMAEVIKALRETADVVILDAPPVLVSTDACMLASIVDSVILVAEAGKTRRDSLGKGAETLSQIKRNVLGVVLNKVKPSASTAYGGYYGSYYQSQQNG